MSDDDGYVLGMQILGIPVFFGSWIYFTIQFGFLGFCLGWLPAIFAAFIIGFLWPLALLAAIGGTLFFGAAVLFN